MTIASDSLTAPAQAAGQWVTQRAQYATRELGDCVEWNADKLGGVPVLKATRISVAQALAESRIPPKAGFVLTSGRANQ